MDNAITGLCIASDIAARYGISSLGAALAACRTFTEEEVIRIAVFGRFKAGKSSFINDLLGKPLLPVGVTPVTSIVTEIGPGPKEMARVVYADGRSEEVGLGTIASFISERQNPENRLCVARVRVETPALSRYDGLLFIDTPGLESVLKHNTQTSLSWLPHAGVALVAVSVDPPLTQQDINLIKQLYRYTPHVSLLLTKVDLLSEVELAEVAAFVQEQLSLHMDRAPDVYPYSVRPGYQLLRKNLEDLLLRQTLGGFREQREAILDRKVETLLRECQDYLTLALKSVETAMAERDAFKRQCAGDKETIDDTKAALRIIVQHSATTARSSLAKTLDPYQAELERNLTEGYNGSFLPGQGASNMRWSPLKAGRLAALAIDCRLYRTSIKES